ncbi:MAG: HD domain-containing protein [Eubacterium sp.]|jgi:uncharacterized protein|nr:HD domain-containing protein [Eubacterium sp.]
MREILYSEKMQSTRQYTQHAKVSVFAHCCMVAHVSLQIAKRFKRFDVESLARGALLHDFFLYDWHGKKLLYLHGYKHSNTAYINSKKHFYINEIEADIIKKHMWPLTLFKLPRFRESWLVCGVDKLCSLCETLRILRYDDEKAIKLLENSMQKVKT